MKSSTELNESNSSAEHQPVDPGVSSVYRYLMYGLSLPERTVRSSAAMIGGAIHESATLLVPQAFRDSKTYDTFVQQMLDVMARDVGGVRQPDDHDAAVADSQDGDQVEDYVARKAVGTFVDLAGMATLHVSPLTVLAIVSDLAYGSQKYLSELADELKREGIIAEDSTIGSTAELLEAIGSASASTADRFDQPPISVQGLRETIQQTTEQLSAIDATRVLPQAEIVRLWHDMRQMADREHVNLFEISSAMTMYAMDQVGTVSHGALTSIRVTGNLLDRHVLNHYWQGLEKIQQQGIYAMLAESSRRYVDALWFNFSSDRPTMTEDIFSGRLPGKIWSGFSEWLKGPGDGSGSC